MPGWPAHAALPGADQGFDLNKLQHRHQLPLLVGQRPQLLLKSREQNALQDALELIQEAGNDKLHTVGVLDVRFGLVTLF